MPKLKINQKCSRALKALFLLLLYVFGKNPFFEHHHHEQLIVAYEQAKPCERAIYYDQFNENCSHHEHLFKSLKKCVLCDHTYSIFEIVPTKIDFKIISKTIFTAWIHQLNTTLLFSSIYFDNKGPPQIFTKSYRLS